MEEKQWFLLLGTPYPYVRDAGGDPITNSHFVGGDEVNRTGDDDETY